MYMTWEIDTLKLAASLFPFRAWPRMEMRKGVTVVPISAPMMVATARERGITPEEVRTTTMESKAPLLWRMAVPSQPAKTPLVVSWIRRTIFSARDSPRMTAADLMTTIPEMKKYTETREPRAFFSRALKQINKPSVHSIKEDILSRRIP